MTFSSSESEIARNPMSSTYDLGATGRDSEDRIGLALIFSRTSDAYRCQEHGIFRTFSLLFFTTFYVALSLSILFSQFHSSRKDNTRAIDPMT